MPIILSCRSVPMQTKCKTDLLFDPKCIDGFSGRKNFLPIQRILMLQILWPKANSQRTWQCKRLVWKVHHTSGCDKGINILTAIAEWGSRRHRNRPLRTYQQQVHTSTFRHQKTLLLQRRLWIQTKKKIQNIQRLVFKEG